MMRIHKFTPVISTVLYAAGDVIGTKLALGSVSGELRSLSVSDNGNQGPAGKVLFFDGDPGVVAADNDAFAFPSGSLAKFLGEVDLPTYATVAAKKVGSLKGIGLALKGNSVFAVIVSTGAPTFTSTSDLHIRFGLTYRP